MSSKNDASGHHACGPTQDPEFFADFAALMRKHPHLSGKYHVVCADHETDILGIDFDSTVGVKRIEGARVITEFVPANAVAESSVCCEWECPINRPCKCVSWWVR
jgi:hypothetical protein